MKPLKKLEELGISPAPWNIKYYEFPAEYGGGRVVGGIVARNGVTRIDMNIGIADANMICASTDMYDALHTLLFSNTGTTNCRNCKGHELGNCKKCSLGKARAALEKAGGAK